MYNEFTFNNITNCLMLNNGSELIDYKFYNKFTDDMSFKQLELDMKEMAAKNNIEVYVIDFTNL